MIVNSPIISAPVYSHTAPAKAKEEETEPTPPEEDLTQISYLPQNPDLLGVRHAKVDGSEIGDGPSDRRLKVTTPRNFPQATKSEKGNFLFRPDDPRFDAANTYYIAARTLEMAETYAAREIPWSFSEDLERDHMLIHPHAGQGTANAFYTSEGGSINFFSYKAADSDIHRTGLQSDVVAHETGHALLDALRPLYISSLAVPAGGFHESFGDMVAMLKALHEESVVGQLKAETRGDLRSSNVVSRVAEQLGFDAYGTPALRDAVNDHKFADQHFLPYYDPNDGSGFGTEAHAYANLFTGAFYDIFEGLYAVQAQDPDVTFTQAISNARDLAGQLLFRGTEFSPVGNPSYPEVALAFLQADEIDNEGGLRPLLEQVFIERKILTPQQIAEFDANIEELPNIRLRKDVTGEKGANRYLADKRDKLGLPEDVEFKFESIHTNEKGETFLTWGTHRDEILDDPDFGMHEGSKFRGIGGLLLVFNADGKLIANNYDAVTDREMTNIRDHLRTGIQGGYMVTDTHDHSAGKLRVEIINDGSGPVLQRAPVVYCGGGHHH